jgi:hypothetical protein
LTSAIGSGTAVLAPAAAVNAPQINMADAKTADAALLNVVFFILKNPLKFIFHAETWGRGIIKNPLLSNISVFSTRFLRFASIKRGLL